MEPIKFAESNVTLQPSGQTYSDNVSEVVPLHAWSDGEQCISCWQMSIKERLLALIFGRVWVATLSGHTQPPIYAEVRRTYFQDT